jgi:hypothetical protein
LSPVSFDGWLPIGVTWSDGQPEVDWCLAGRDRLLEPFFEDSIARLLARPFNKVFRRRTGADELEAWAARQPGLTPSGFIFHMSRCGSTLVAQMLAALSDSVVLSEPAPVDSMLRPPVPIPQDQHIRWLKALISALGQPRSGHERYYVVKLDCWHVLYLSLIRQAFPSVPQIFLYREPRQVLASHLRQRGVQTVPGLIDPRLFGIEQVAAVTMPAVEYCARVLGTICDSAKQVPAAGLVNYRQLPGAVLDTIMPQFGVSAGAGDFAAMQTVVKFHSKRSGLEFSPADDPPPLAFDDSTHAIINAFLDAPYHMLEERRMSVHRSLGSSSNPAVAGNIH